MVGCVSMFHIETTTLTDCLSRSFSIYRLPHIIVSDNDPSFVSGECKRFY